MSTETCSTKGPEQHATELLADIGYFVVPNAAPLQLVERSLAAVYSVRDRIEAEVGAARIQRARDEGDDAIRLPFCYDPVFFELLQLDAVTESVDLGLDRAAVLRFMNAAICLPGRSKIPTLSQHRWHRNFPEHPAGERLTLEVALFLNDLSDASFVLVPGTHRRTERPSEPYLDQNAVPIHVSAGSLFVMDSRLWHRELPNVRNANYVTINLQFARHYLKTHFDHPRALGATVMSTLPARTQYFLGARTRTPSSLDEFYVQPEQRLYRPLPR